MTHASVRSDTEQPGYAHRIRGLQIVELPTMAHERTWTIHRDLDTIAIQVGLPERDRRRALAEALTEMTSGKI